MIFADMFKDVENSVEIYASDELTFRWIILRILEEQVEASLKLIELLEEATRYRWKVWKKITLFVTFKSI